VVALENDWEDDAPPARSVRPYTLTAGRTRARVDLPVEAVLELQPLAGRPDPHGLSGKILEVAAGQSVAEVSARVRQPIGVVRVLLGDLVEQGYVKVRATLDEDASMDERRDLIERTLRGLRSL
jgi:Protein of unknown function (DUF742)